MLFLKVIALFSDSDARAQGGAHAYAHLWDNGKNPVDELERVLNVREKAISTFSKDNIRTSEPFSVLEDMFVPLYFFTVTKLRLRLNGLEGWIIIMR